MACTVHWRGDVWAAGRWTDRWTVSCSACRGRVVVLRPAQCDSVSRFHTERIFIFLQVKIKIMATSTLYANEQIVENFNGN